MPGHATHDAINLVAYGAALVGYGTAASAGLVEPLPIRPVFTFTVAYLVGTFLVTPDLDLRVSKPGKRWGLLRVLWMPYASLMTHRRRSHGYLLGPLTRLVYLAILLAPLAHAPALLTPLREFSDGYFTRSALVGAAAGFYASQWMHLLADRAPPRL